LLRALSNHVVMVESSSSNGSPDGNEQGVFAKLPRTRPQRDSPRRAAARNSSPRPARAKASRARAKTQTPAKRSQSIAEPAQANARRSQAAPQRPPAAAAGRRAQRTTAPRQGFESEGDRRSRSLQPPGAADLVVSAAELVSEIAKGGLSRGERLVRDLLSRRP
jgi:hypothetical protein